MSPNELSVGRFSKEEIHQQLQKIIADPSFTVSEILQKFLLFVSHETLEGRSNQLKEYTIALKVLNKPLHFNPSQDAIVRIHACRLRRALDRYYRVTGADDPIYVSIPKGSYIPAFADHTPKPANELHFANASEIATALRHPEKHVMKSEMLYARDRLMITVNILNIETSQQVWKYVMEYEFSNITPANLQDEIARKLIEVVSDCYKFINLHTAYPKNVAVA